MRILITPYDNTNFYNSLIEIDNANIYYSNDEDNLPNNKKLIKIKLTNLTNILKHDELNHLDVILSSDIRVIKFAKDNKIRHIFVNSEFDIGKIRNMYLSILNEIITEKKEKTLKYNIAYVSPLPLDKSGIADYSEDLVYEIDKYFNVDVYTNTKKVNLKKSEIFELKKLYDTYFKYDLIIYNIGNDYNYHGDIFIMATRIPGLIILHDYKINDLMLSLCNIEDMKFYNKNIYNESVYDQSCKSLLNGIRLINKDDTITFNLLNKCRGVITHTIWAFDQMRKKYQTNISNNIFYVPMGNHGGNNSNDYPDNNIIDNIKKTNAIKFGVFGHMTPNKRIDKIIQALKIVTNNNNLNIHLYLVGKEYANNSAVPGYKNISDMVKKLDIEKYVTIIDFVDITTFNKLIENMNVAIGLRYPTNGESSGTITKFLYYNKPCIISDVDQFKDFPNICTFKLPVNLTNEQEIELLASFIIKLTDDKLRNEMSENAKLYSKLTLMPNIMTNNIINIIRKIIESKNIDYEKMNINTKEYIIGTSLIDILGFHNEIMIKKLNNIQNINILENSNVEQYETNYSTQIFKEIKNMTEFEEYKNFINIGKNINNLYKLYLNRNAIISDVYYIYDQIMRKNITLEILKINLLNSDEHKNYMTKICNENQRAGEINEIYLNLLNRNVDYDGLNFYLKQSNEEILNSISKSEEYNVCKLVNQTYWKILHRVPDEEGFNAYFSHINDKQLTIEQMEKCFYDSYEYNYNVKPIEKFIKYKIKLLQEQHDQIKVVDDLLKNIKIKYICPLGTSGYAIAALDYMYVLHKHGASITFDYPYVERLNKLENGPKFNQQILLYNKKIDYDYVIIHCMPDHWHNLCKLERYNNMKTKIFGLFAWETDVLPKEWIKHLNSVDALIVPSQYNKIVTETVIKKPIYTIEHLIEFNDYIPKNISNKDYTFLIVSQWNARKCVEETIRCYLSTFSNKDNTLLYVKTFVNNNKNDNNKLKIYIENIVKNYQNPPKIIINVDYLNDNDMFNLYYNCDCFLSLCHSEGVGLGACQSAYLKKSVIITGYGGQIDYIKTGYFVDYILDYVKPCIESEKLFRDHSTCTRTKCIHNEYLDGSIMKWAYPNQEQFKKIMRYLYENEYLKLNLKEYEKIRENTEINYKYIKNNFSSITIANKFKEVIKN